MLLIVNAGLTLSFYKRYVDDGNILCPQIERSMVWDKNLKCLRRREVEEEDVSPDEWTAKVLKDIADSVSQMLVWTTDFPSAHQNRKLPVLDICTWTVEKEGGTFLEYEFYSKPITNPVMIPANSAMPKGIKIASYRQEVLRVLSNTSYTLPWERKAELLSDLAKRMEMSGYGTGFIVTAINGGVRAYLKCLADHQQSGRPIHRPRNWEGRRNVRRRNTWFQPGGDGSEFSSVIFVPSTPGSMLAKILQKQESENNQGRTHRIRIVEKSGVSVRDFLAKNYPWGVRKCDQEDCFQCSTCPDPKFSCRKPGIGYTITCLLCSSWGVNAVYQGESSKNAYARGKKHLEELRAALRTNGMVIHNSTHHDSVTENNFMMRVVRCFSKPLDRQIDESVRIKDSLADIVMNSGSEWRGDKVPRASFHPGGQTG